jgi:molybdenum-dependent DNA-binding transcriptional regulator ModE
MEMHQIRYFLALCEERSFTRAAKHCGVAQPSLTNAIKNLERELGQALFNRSRTGAALTPLGAALRRHFLRIEQSVAAIRTEAESVSSKLAMQPHWRRELAMSKNLLLSVAVLLPLFGIGGIVGTSMHTGPTKTEPVAAITIDPHALTWPSISGRCPSSKSKSRSKGAAICSAKNAGF